MALRFITLDDFRRFWGEFKYPKFVLLVFTFVVAYMLFAGQQLAMVREYFVGLGYLGTFLAGMLYSYGFTAAPATGIMLVLAKEQNIFIAAPIAGLGSLVADFLIFKFIRHSFADEIEHLKNEPLTQYLHTRIPDRIKKYIVPVIGCLIIGSPLPDELGVTLLAVSNISTRLFMVLSYCLNTLGILLVLFIGTLL